MLKLDKQYAFTFWLLIAVGLAMVFPEAGSKGGFLHTESTTQLGVWSIFFLQGLSLSTKELTAGYKPKRLHAFVLGWNFLFFPLVTGVVLLLFGDLLSEDLKLGFWLLGIMPTTVASAIAFTTIAGGNPSNAIFSTVYSNVFSIWLVPMLFVAYLTAEMKVEIALGPLFAKLGLLILLPLIVGQLIRRIVPVRSAAVAARTKVFGSAIILFIVHAAFAESVASGFLDKFSFISVVAVLLFSILLVLLVSAGVWLTSAWLKLERDRRIAGFFCASQKSLATGLPLATSILAASGDVVESAILLLPLICYHPLQLILAGVVSGRIRACQS